MLYQHFLRTADDTSCTVKFSTTQVGRATNAKARRLVATPFNLAAVQSHLGRLLHPPWLMVLWRAGRNVVQNQTLVDCLCASVRRFMQLPYFTFEKQARKLGWGKCAYLQRIAYTAVRDEVLAQICVARPEQTLRALTQIGVKFDAAIVGSLLQYKQALVRRHFNDSLCDTKIQFFTDEGRRSKPPRKAYGATALVRAFGRQPHSQGYTCWRWLQYILMDLHRILCAEAPAGDGPVGSDYARAPLSGYREVRLCLH